MSRYVASFSILFYLFLYSLLLAALLAACAQADGTVESRVDEITVLCAASAPRKPMLHLLAVGVDRYQAGLQLRFARRDACCSTWRVTEPWWASCSTTSPGTAAGPGAVKI